MAGRIGSPMGIGSLWETCREEPEVGREEKLNGPGWEEIGTGTFVPEGDAFNYALERCLDGPPEGACKMNWTGEFREMLVGWYFSGNWVWEE